LASAASAKRSLPLLQPDCQEAAYEGGLFLLFSSEWMIYSSEWMINSGTECGHTRHLFVFIRGLCDVDHTQPESEMEIWVDRGPESRSEEC
jgi:hypothetical protein